MVTPSKPARPRVTVRIFVSPSHGNQVDGLKYAAMRDPKAKPRRRHRSDA